jgi:hypothetical protein
VSESLLSQWLKITVFFFIPVGALFVITAVADVKTFEIQVIERQVTGENELIRVTQGDDVVLNWHTDETVTVHLHGYDIEQRIEAGLPVDMSFTAHATGRFPVTSHGFENQHDDHGHQTLLYFEVHPE